ncbi:DUF6531 domain-containing protein [Chitinimonas sp. PSY-7]|uniref:DUF6531 domain-containing protein n=1 Tax=Chitinimonas sp. PSY-7 TaxID=3459088 RepID=UPI00404030FB
MNFTSSTLTRAVAIALAGGLLSSTAYAAGTCDPKNGIPSIGAEVAALSNNFGDGTYELAMSSLKCVNGEIVSVDGGTAVIMSPDDMERQVKAMNMRRYYSNSCKTHQVAINNYFKGVINGVDFSGPTPPKSIPGMLYYADTHAKCSTDGGMVGDLLLGGNIGSGCPGSSNDDVPEPPVAECGNPIQPGTGNKFQTEVDYQGGGANRLSIIRHYNSLTGIWNDANIRQLAKFEKKPGSLPGAVVVYLNGEAPTGGSGPVTNPGGPSTPGSGVDVGETWQATRGDGKIISFPLVGGGADHNGLGYNLQITADRLQLTTPANSVELYDLNGRLLSVQQRDGYTLTYAYDTAGKLTTITDSNARVLTYTHDALGRVTSIKDPAQKAVAYGYDAKGRLSTVTYPDGKTREYLYEDTRLPNALTGIKDEAGIRFATWAYDAQGRAISSEHSGGAEKVTISYPDSTQATAVNVLGLTTNYTFQSVKGRTVLKTLTESCPTCTTTTQQFEVDPNGLMTKRTDRLGTATQYQSDATRRLTTQRVAAAGKPEALTADYEWHPTLRLPTKITEGGLRTDLTYDPKGNLTNKVVTALSNNSSETWRWGYDPQNRLTESTDPAGLVSRYTYDATGNLATATDPAGLVTRYTQYNADGLPLSITRPNGGVITLTYDQRGRLLSQSDGGLTTTYTYSPTGLLSTVTTPDGNQLTYTYDDARRLTGVRDKLGNSVRYVLNPAGNRTREEVLAGSSSVSALAKRIEADLIALTQPIPQAS